VNVVLEKCCLTPLEFDSSEYLLFKLEFHLNHQIFKFFMHEYISFQETTIQRNIYS